MDCCLLLQYFRVEDIDVIYYDLCWHFNMPQIKLETRAQLFEAQLS